jgi:glucose-1-phosphate thymidylyltransferase
MAGKANRMPDLPFSKELIPFEIVEDHLLKKTRIKVISDGLIAGIKRAGVERFYLVLRTGKWDIPAYFKGGSGHQIAISYHVVDNESAVPFTIDSVFSFIQNKNVLFGFPDIYFQPEDVFIRLRDRIEKETGTDMVLGLIPVDQPHKWDVVSFNKNNEIEAITIKKTWDQKRAYAWCLAAWKPSFTGFLHQYLQKTSQSSTGKDSEIQLSEIIMEFIQAGYGVKGELFREGVCIDTGTYEDLREALNKYAGFNLAR